MDYTDLFTEYHYIYISYIFNRLYVIMLITSLSLLIYVLLYNTLTLMHCYNRVSPRVYSGYLTAPYSSWPTKNYSEGTTNTDADPSGLNSLVSLSRVCMRNRSMYVCTRAIRNLFGCVIFIIFYAREILIKYRSFKLNYKNVFLRFSINIPLHYYKRISLNN